MAELSDRLYTAETQTEAVRDAAIADLSAEHTREKERLARSAAGKDKAHTLAVGQLRLEAEQLRGDRTTLTQQLQALVKSHSAVRDGVGLMCSFSLLFGC